MEFRIDFGVDMFDMDPCWSLSWFLRMDPTLGSSLMNSAPGSHPLTIDYASYIYLDFDRSSIDGAIAANLWIQRVDSARGLNSWNLLFWRFTLMDPVC